MVCPEGKLSRLAILTPSIKCWYSSGLKNTFGLGALKLCFNNCASNPETIYEIKIRMDNRCVFNVKNRITASITTNNPSPKKVNLEKNRSSDLL